MLLQIPLLPENYIGVYRCPYSECTQYTYLYSKINNCYKYTDKIVWNTNNVDSFLNYLNSKKYLFDDISDKLTSGEIDINNYVNCFSDIVYNISFQCFGKTFSSKPRAFKKKAPWFNDECRMAKREFLNFKRTLALHSNEENKMAFLLSRGNFISIKRKAKRMFYSKEKVNLSKLSKNSPRKFWKYIKKFNSKNKKVKNDINMKEFIETF